MFIKLDKEDICAYVSKGGRDVPCGDAYINTNYISFIDGNFVTIGNHIICCTDKGLQKVLMAINTNY